jgi:hypothetical protein
METCCAIRGGSRFCIPVNHIHLSLPNRVWVAIMAKIINFDTFCYRRELKAMEKELKRKEAIRDKSIKRLLEHAKKHCNWEKRDDPVDNE